MERTGSGQADALDIAPADDAFDTIMLGTRMTGGIALDELAARHGETFVEQLMPELERLAARGLARLDDGRLRLTEEGMMLQNTVLVEIMEKR